MTENKQNHNHSWHDRLSHGGVLRVLRRNVMLRAALAIVTVVLTIVLVVSLTVAWYTNVVQTGGLVLEAETWNFTGTIELLMDTPIQATPGDEGFIPVRVANSGEHIVAASATVNKKTMDVEMQKRLYFYVDTVTERNGESVERIYIAEKNSYTYTVFPHSDLILSEAVQTAPPIKWIWVYDVLGYYVMGSRDIAGTSVEVADYIRPIEYAYDPIYTTFAADGRLLTVDGTKSASDFITELTESDGYEGTVDTLAGNVGGYYPVSVNEQGYGVWLYLCTADEIRANTDYDTKLGQNQTQPNCTATVTITGSNSREDAIPVTSAQELQVALSDPTVGIIRLADNVQLTQTLSMTSGSATIDLNGNTLSVGFGVDKIATLTSGAILSIENGSIAGDGTTRGVSAFEVSGSRLILNDVNISDVDTGVRVLDKDKNATSSSTVYIHGGVIDAGLYGVRVDGNPDGVKTRTQVVMSDATIRGNGYAGILFSGNYGGGDTVITNCEVTGKYTAIYHPQKDSTLTIQGGSTLSGGTGLVVKSGTVTVKDSTIHGTMQGTEPTYNPSGWADTGDGIYLEANYATEEWPVKVTVTNCDVTSEHAYAVRKYEATSKYAVLIVESGMYSSFAYATAAVPDGFDATTWLSSYLAVGSTATNIPDDTKICVVQAGD